MILNKVYFKNGKPTIKDDSRNEYQLCPMLDKAYSGTINTSGNYEIDFNTDWAVQHNLTLGAGVTIEPKLNNLFEANQSTVITMNVTGGVDVDFSTNLAWLDASPNNDSYSPSAKNKIVILIEKGGASPSGYYTLENI